MHRGQQMALMETYQKDSSTFPNLLKMARKQCWEGCYVTSRRLSVHDLGSAPVLSTQDWLSK